MSEYLKKFELIPEGVEGLSAITLAGNDTDPYFSVKLNRITDTDAEALLARADGRGARYVRAIPEKISVPEKPAKA